MQDGATCEGEQACIGATQPLINAGGQCYAITVRYLHRAHAATFKLWYQQGSMQGGRASFDRDAPWHAATVWPPAVATGGPSVLLWSVAGLWTPLHLPALQSRHRGRAACRSEHDTLATCELVPVGQLHALPDC